MGTIFLRHTIIMAVLWAIFGPTGVLVYMGIIVAALAAKVALDY